MQEIFMRENHTNFYSAAKVSDRRTRNHRKVLQLRKFVYRGANKNCSFAHCSFAHLLISLIAHSLICSFRSNQMSVCERFSQIAQDKWATMSELLWSLRGNERSRAIRSGCSEEMSNVSETLILLTKNERMSALRKTFWLKNLKSCLTIFYLRFKKKNRNNKFLAIF